MGEFYFRKTGQNSNGKQNPDSEEKDVKIFTAFPCPGSMPSSYDINVSVSFGESSGAAEASPLTGKHGGTNDPGAARGNFESFCLNTLENHFLSLWMPSRQDISPGHPKREPA